MTNIRIREIIETDIENGFLETLDRLRKASDLDKEIGKNILRKIISNPDYIIEVVEENGKIIGSATLFIEQKKKTKKKKKKHRENGAYRRCCCVKRIRR